MSSISYLSTSWYRVQALTPRLAEHVRIHRHRYRGELWYVIDDRVTGRVHRFNPAAYVVMRALDGEKTMDAVWRECVELLGEEAPGQDEVIHLLGQLYANDLLKCQVLGDSAELFARYVRQNKSLWWQNLRNPLSMKLPLWNPAVFLEATLPLLRPLFSRWGLLLWLVIVLGGLTLAAQHWHELSADIGERMLTTHSLLALWVLFPFIKLLHEMGHAYATRAQGGEVHEMGIMILALMVVPYVDAGSAAGFGSRWRRALVGAAGMMVELVIASFAVVAWTLLEPGLLRTLMYDVIFIAGVSTLVFNVNPLLRYDGYYILGDLLEIPNLAQRARQYWQFLVDYHLFRVARKDDDDSTVGEKIWFLLYAPASLAYRFGVMMGIALFLANQLFFLGVVLAIWVCAAMLGVPLFKGLRYVLLDTRLHDKRRRALLVSSGLTAIAAALMLWVPLPLRTQADGVLWLPEQAEVRAGTGGFINRILMANGAAVVAGDALVECEDPALEAEIRVSRAKLEELNAHYMDDWVNDKVRAQVTRESIANEEAKLASAMARKDQLVIRSRADGRLQIADPQDLPGRYLRKGELIGLVVNGAADLARVVVSQDDIDLVRRHTRSVDVRFAHQPERIYPAEIIREIPGAQAELPSAALGTVGGGERALDPHDEHGTKGMNRLFQFDIGIVSDSEGLGTLAPYGSRLYVRFHHVAEPLARQWGRRLRQLFLERLSV